MAVRKKDRNFQNVAATTTVDIDYTPANGDVLLIGECYGQAGSSPDTMVAVIWDDGGGDEKVLFCTHSSGLDSYVDFAVTGDGTKKLTMRIVNNQATADFMGIGWRD